VLPGGIQTLNAAGGRINGLELEATAVPDMQTGKLQVGLNLTMLDGEYKGFTNAPYYLPNPYASVPTGFTCPTPNSVSPGGNTACTFDASGNTVIRAPKWTANLNLSYAVPVGDGQLELSGNYFYNNGFFWEPTNRVKQPSYHLLNGQITYSFSNNLKLRIFGRNLTDELYYSSVSEQSLGDLGTAAAPRTYGIGINFTY
jgi:iron complex outermembrane receptor protein